MFKKRETLLQNIAFMGIVAAINVLLSFLACRFLIAGLFIVLLLPFLSALVSLFCKWKYYPIYAVATIGVALIFLLSDAQFTVFYLIPGIITGFLFGLSFHFGLNEGLSILITTLVQTLLTFAFIPLINLIFDKDLILTFLQLLKLNNKAYIECIVPSFIFLISLIQMLFTYIILINEIRKFNVKDIHYLNEKFIMVLFGLIISISVIPLAFWYVPISYLFMSISLYINICIFIDIILSKIKSIIVISSAFELLGLILVLALNQVVKIPYTLLLMNSSNILIFVFALLYNQKRDF